MRKAFTLVMFVGLYLQSFTQALITKADYQKAPQPAVTVEIPFPEKTVSKAIEDKLGKLGYKGKDSKGFTIYKGVRMQEIGPDSYDLYFKTDRKDKKEKDVTIVTLLIASGYDKFIDDSQVMNNAKTFLDSSLAMVESFDLEQQIEEQESLVKKQDKKMANLTDEANDLQKKKKKLEKDIEDNLKAQEDQKKEVETQGLVLDTLKRLRKQ